MCNFAQEIEKLTELMKEKWRHFKDVMALWWRYYAISLSWLLLIIFFTYTAVLSSIFLTGKCFDEEYFKNQCQVISMIVNMGLMAMVVFDYMSAGKQMSNKDVVLLIIGMLLVVGIYGHSGIMDSKAGNQYEIPLNWTGFSFLQHLILFTILWKLKAKSLFALADDEYRPAENINHQNG